MRKTLQNILRFCLYLGLGVGILYWVYDKQNEAYQAKCVHDGLPADQCQLTDKIISDFGMVDWSWILVVLGCFMLSNVSRAIRWNMLLEPLGIRPRFHNSFFTVMIGYLANLGLSRIGEVVRAATFAKYENTKTNLVMGTVVVDRMLDALTMLFVVIFAIFLDGDRILGYMTRNADIGGIRGILLSPYLWIATFLFFGAAVTLFRYRARFEGHPLAARIIEVLRGFRDGMKSVRKVKRMGWFVFHSLAIWALYYLMTYLCFMGFEPTRGLGPVAGMTTFVFGSFGIVIPTPGGMGTYQFLVSESLVMHGIPNAEAFSFSMILFFSIQIFGSILFGALGFLLLPLLNRKPKTAEA